MCAGVLAPVVVAGDVTAGLLATTGAGVASSVGSNVLTDVLSGAVSRLRRRERDSVIEPEALRRELATALERGMADRGAAGAALRELAAGIVRESGAIRAIVEGATSADPQALDALATGLAGLGRQFGEFSSLAGDLRREVSSLRREAAAQSADRRVATERAREHTALLEQVLETLRRQAVEGGVPEEARWVGCPYPGLAPFGPREAQVFYGRRRMTRLLIRAVTDRARGGGFLVVLGASGAGKSSLLQAGLAASMLAQGRQPGLAHMRCRVITPTTDPLVELSAHVADLGGREAHEVLQILSLAPRRAPELLAQTSASRNTARGHSRAQLVLVVDQLEEMFTLVAPGENGRARREQFMAALEALAALPQSRASRSSAPAAVIVLAVRGDFLDQALAFPAVAASVRTGAFVVEPMTRAELREVITGPAAEAGVSVEDRLVREILREVYHDSAGAVGSSAGVLPLLSQALATTWRVRRGEVLTLRAYRRAGGMADGVDRAAQRVYNALDEPGRRVARAMFLRLTQISGDGRVVRRSSTRAELYAAAEVSQADGDAVVGAFADQRLLVLNDDSVQICHDVLLDSWRLLHQWQQGDAVDRALYSQVVADADVWQQHTRASDYLYRPRQLAAVRTAMSRWAKDPERYPPLTPVARAFVDDSHQAERRGTRRRRSVIAGLTALAVAACTTAAFAIAQTNDARIQHSVALSRQLAAASLVQASLHPVTAGQLAVAAWATAHTPQAADAMTTLLMSQRRAGVTVTSARDLGSVQFSPDGEILAAAGDDGDVRLFDAATGQPLSAPIAAITPQMRVDTLIGPLHDASPELSIAFSPDGRLLAAGGNDEIERYNPSDGQFAGAPMHLPKGGIVTSLSFNPAGTKLAAGTEDGSVYLFDPATDQQLRSVIHTASGSQVYSVAFSPDGHMLAIGEDGGVKLADPDTGQLLEPEILDMNPAPPLSLPPLLAPSPGSSSASASQQPTKDEVPNVVESVAFSPSGKVLAAGGDGGVELFDPVTGQTLGSPISSGSATGLVSSMAFSPSGGELAAGYDSGTVELIDTRTEKLRRTPITVGAPAPGARHSQGWVSIAFNPSGKSVAVGGNDGTLRLLDPLTGEPLGGPSTADVDASQVNSLAYSPDGETVALGDANGKVEFIDAVTGRRRGPAITAFSSDEDAGSEIFSVAFSPDGKILAVAGSDGYLKFLDPASGREARSPFFVPDQFIELGSVIFSPDGKLLAVSDNDGRVLLFNVVTGQRIASPTAVKSSGNEAISMAFSPDGGILATSSNDGTVLLFDADTGKRLESLVFRSSSTAHAVYGLAFSPDGSMLAVGSGNQVSLFSLDDWRPVRSIIPSSDVTTSIAFSHDGELVALSDGNGSVEFFDPTTGVSRGKLTNIIAEDSNGEMPFAFSPDGSSIAIGDRDGTIQQWPVSIFVDSYSKLCSDVGGLDSDLWAEFAPGEQQTAECSGM